MLCQLLYVPHVYHVSCHHTTRSCIEHPYTISLHKHIHCSIVLLIFLPILRFRFPFPQLALQTTSRLGNSVKRVKRKGTGKDIDFLLSPCDDPTTHIGACESI